ncbi:MAG: hypothetical protein AAB414_01835 [Patescibacteria group bacterium]
MADSSQQELEHPININVLLEEIKLAERNGSDVSERIAVFNKSLHGVFSIGIDLSVLPDSEKRLLKDERESGILNIITRAHYIAREDNQSVEKKITVHTPRVAGKLLPPMLHIPMEIGPNPNWDLEIPIQAVHSITPAPKV